MGKKNKGKIYLNKEGYEKYLADIENLRKQILKNNLEKSDAYENCGDGFHDNFTFEQAEQKERGLTFQLEQKIKGLENIVIVENQNDENKVDINDVVILTIDFGDDIETDKYRLIASDPINHGDGIINISVNSPLGDAIYLKSIGEEVFYSVGGNRFQVHIDSKMETIETEKAKVKELNSK